MVSSMQSIPKPGSYAANHSSDIRSPRFHPVPSHPLNLLTQPQLLQTVLSTVPSQFRPSSTVTSSSNNGDVSGLVSPKAQDKNVPLQANRAAPTDGVTQSAESRNSNKSTTSETDNSDETNGKDIPDGVSEDDVPMDDESDDEDEEVAKSVTKNKSTPFVHATYDIAMLDNAAVGFNAAGNALEIRDDILLANEVLPKFFKHNNVSSFIRQLNMYGFEKIVGSVNSTHTFQHEHFRKNRPDLLNQISRKQNKMRIPRKRSEDARKERRAEQLLKREMPAHQNVRSKPTPFVHATYELAMLNNEAIGFTNAGTALEIRNEALLAETFLPKYFKHKNVSSFIRQLNMYGFEKTDSSSGVVHTFQHECFEQNREDLLARITRKHVKIDKKSSSDDASRDDAAAEPAEEEERNETLDAVTGLTLLRNVRQSPSSRAQQQQPQQQQLPSPRPMDSPHFQSDLSPRLDKFNWLNGRDPMSSGLSNGYFLPSTVLQQMPLLGHMPSLVGLQNFSRLTMPFASDLHAGPNFVYNHPQFASLAAAGMENGDFSLFSGGSFPPPPKFFADPKERSSSSSSGNNDAMSAMTISSEQHSSSSSSSSSSASKDARGNTFTSGASGSQSAKSSSTGQKMEEIKIE